MKRLVCIKVLLIIIFFNSDHVLSKINNKIIANVGNQIITDLDIEGTSYTAWNLYDVEPNTGPFIYVEGLPDASVVDLISNQLSNKEFWRISIPVAVVIILLIVVPWLVLRSRKVKLRM